MGIYLDLRSVKLGSPIPVVDIVLGDTVFQSCSGSLGSEKCRSDLAHDTKRT
jgi:hypothetical protein